MKKMIAMLLVAVMAVSMAACTGGETTPTTTAPVETTAPQVQGPASALEVLNTVWVKYADDQKFFVIGGDFNAPVDGAPGTVTDQAHMTSSLVVPEAELANISEVAAMMHAMNANTFTCGAYKLVDGADAAAFATAMQTAIQGNQWMCGFPEKLLIANVGGIVVVAFGHGDAMTPFQTNLTAAYADAQIVVNEAIGG